MNAPKRSENWSNYIFKGCGKLKMPINLLGILVHCNICTFYVLCVTASICMLMPVRQLCSAKQILFWWHRQFALVLARWHHLPIHNEPVRTVCVVYWCGLRYLTDGMMWLPSLSCNPKLPRLTKCMHLLWSARLEGNLVDTWIYRAPPYLSDYCFPGTSAATQRHLCSTNRQLLAIPLYRLDTYGRNAFSVASPTVWNSLPDFIRDPTISVECFRRLLKTYLFTPY